jgi:hypothetical protein
MSVVHMDIGETRRIRKKLVSVQEDIKTIVDSTNASMVDLSNYWKANSANVCTSRYQSYTQSISKILKNLKKSASDLKSAIDTMERLDKHF